jgi:hypothetical protein
LIGTEGELICPEGELIGTQGESIYLPRRPEF